MIERLIYDALTTGVAFLRDTPGAVSKLFTDEDILDAKEAAALEDLFRNKQTPGVHMGYPRKDVDFPAFFITLASDDETQAFLGDEGSQILDPEDEEFGADQFAALFAYQYSIWVYALNPDVTLAYYQLLKHMVIAFYPTFKANGLYNLKFSGADMAPDPAYVPAGLFLRRASLSCAREYTQTWLSSKLGRAWKVRSMHVDAAGAPGEDVGGVLTHVTIPENEEG